MIKKYWPIGLFTLVMPMMSVMAQGVPDDKVLPVLQSVKNWVDALIPILVGIALLYFIWSTIKLITTDNSEKREEAKMGMWWGIIALFVIISIWGIVRWIGATVGITNQDNSPIQIPGVPDTTTAG